MEDSNKIFDDFLGPSPWEKAHLRKCYFRDFARTREEIEKLPGGIIFTELRTLQLSLKIFISAVEDLQTSINNFKYQSGKPNFWHTINRPFAEKLEVSVHRGILSSTLCAMALVDHCRIFHNEYKIDGYEDEKNKYFRDNELHGFIQSLRRYFAHVRFSEANWLIKDSGEGRSVFFFLNIDSLSRFEDWSSSAKKYISNHKTGINIEELYEAYCKNVMKFHNWLFFAVFNKYGQELSEYLKYMRQINGFSSESDWNILVSQIVKQNNLNPYLYLHQLLNDDQIEDVFSRPFRSREQVDRIIELVDSYKICTERLRREVYEIFNVDK
jgi:hypothetical protein